MIDEQITTETELLAIEKGYPNETFSGDKPTQSLVQKWLRKKHKLHISIDIGHDETNIWWNFNIFKIELGYNHNPIVDMTNYDGFKTPEEALEKGLQEGLKLI